MKYTAALAFAAPLLSSVTASPVHLEARQNVRPPPNPSINHCTVLTTHQGGSGAGPYAPATYKTESSLRDHTIYYPTKSTGTTKMPVFIWGNGACSNQGLSNQALLQQIASYGFLAISEGGPQGGGGSNSQTMKAAIDWVSSNAGQGNYANVDASKIMAAGFSCGGTEAMDNIWDSRVDTIGVVSSGLLSNYTAASAWRKPVLFVMGGSGDIAYQNVSFCPPPPPLTCTRKLTLLPGRA